MDADWDELSPVMPPLSMPASGPLPDFGSRWPKDE